MKIENEELRMKNERGSLVFPVEINISSKTGIDSKGFTNSGFSQNANFHGKYQRAMKELSSSWFRVLGKYWIPSIKRLSQNAKMKPVFNT